MRRTFVAVLAGLAAMATTATGTSAAQPDQVSSLLHSMTLAEKVGQLFMTYGYGPTADTVDARNQQEFGVDTPAELVQRYHLGGVIYFQWSDNLDNPTQIAQLSNGLQRAAISSGAHIPLMISTDQEEGLVTRIGAPATTFPGSMALGATRSTSDAEKAAAITGRELRAMGVNMDNAPDSDVNVNPANPVIGVRSFGADPTLVSHLVSAQVRGYQSSVVTTAKHFPGHGDAATDSHTGLPVIDHDKATWEKIDAPPFRAAIASGVDVIMTAHIVFPKIDPSGDPSTLSPIVLTGMLRDELGYKGVVITDSLQMAGVRQKYTDAQIPVKALQAGADMLLMPENVGVAVNAVMDAVKSGQLSEQRIDQSVARILAAKLRRGVLFNPFTNVNAVAKTVGTPRSLATAQRITDASITVLSNGNNVLPLKSKSVLVTGWGVHTKATLAADLGPIATTSPTGDYDTIVVLTNGADSDPAQQQEVHDLVATGKPVIAVGVGNPYDPGAIQGPAAWIDTYSYTAVSMKSLSRVLLGEVGPRGKLPVDIPNSYSFGSGMTW